MAEAKKHDEKHAEKSLEIDLGAIAPYALGAVALYLLYNETQKPDGIFSPGGILGPKTPTLTPAQIAELERRRAAAQAQGDFATAAKLAGEIAQSKAAATLAQGLVSGIASLWSSASAADSMMPPGPGADVAPADSGWASQTSDAGPGADVAPADGGWVPQTSDAGPGADTPPADSGWTPQTSDAGPGAGGAPADSGWVPQTSDAGPGGYDPMQSAVESTPYEDWSVQGLPFSALVQQRLRNTQLAKAVLRSPTMYNIANFQMQEGLPMTGDMDAMTHKRLIERSQGV